MKNKRTGLETKTILDGTFPISPKHFVIVFKDFIRVWSLEPENFQRWKLERGSTRNIKAKNDYEFGQWLLRKPYYLPGNFIAEIMVTPINPINSRVLITIFGNIDFFTKTLVDPINQIFPSEIENDQYTKWSREAEARHYQEYYDATLLLRKFTAYLQKTYLGSDGAYNVDDLISENTMSRKKGPSYFQEDLWAWEQIIIHHRPIIEIKKAWINMVKKNIDNGDRKLEVSNFDRTFYKITREKWGKNKCN